MKTQTPWFFFQQQKRQVFQPYAERSFLFMRMSPAERQAAWAPGGSWGPWQGMERMAQKRRRSAGKSNMEALKIDQNSYILESYGSKKTYI